jgi:hypothetical protein
MPSRGMAPTPCSDRLDRLPCNAQRPPARAEGASWGDHVLRYIWKVVVTCECRFRVSWSGVVQLSSDIQLMGVWMEGLVLAHRNNCVDALRHSPVGLESLLRGGIIKLASAERMAIMLATGKGRIVVIRCLSTHIEIRFRHGIIVLSRGQRSAVALAGQNGSTVVPPL